MTSRDPIELFRSLNPFPTEAFADRDEQLLDAILATPFDGDDLSLRRRRRQWLAGLGVLATVGATAAFAALRSEQATDPFSAVCFAEVDLDADRVALGAVEDPIAACTAEWENGAFADAATPAALSGCVQPNGVAAVFPTGAACSQLDLPELDPGLADDRAVVQQIGVELSELFGTDCVDRDTALDTVAESVAGTSAAEWPITFGEPFTEATPCAAIGFDATAEVIVLIGVAQ